MFISLTRYSNHPDSTGGLLYVDGAFFCYTCEDQAQLVGIKIPGETRIPNGVYTIGLRDQGGMTKKYNRRFPGLHKGMLWLQDVPNFEWVYIHIGNDDDDTLGCILVGDMPGAADAKEATVRASTSAYRRLYAVVIDAIESGESVVIDVSEVEL